MAQLNITLNQEEILQLLSKDHDQAFRDLLRKSLNSILMAESTAELKAEPYERSEERTDSRNGTRVRDLKSRIGKITLTVPIDRKVPFSSRPSLMNGQKNARTAATVLENAISRPG